MLARAVAHPYTRGAVIVEVDVSGADVDGELSVIVVLSTHHMYAACFVPHPPGALLH